MVSETSGATTKISAKIWRLTLDKLNAKLEKACLRRDAYLNRVLAVELDHLESEVPIPNAPEAQGFIARRLDAVRDRKVATFTLQKPLVDRLNAICEERRLVRDAVLNRLLLLLAANPQAIDRLFFGGKDWRTEVWSECKHDGPFFQNTFYPLEPDIDPFWPIREGIKLVFGEFATDSTLIDLPRPGIYSSFFHDQMFRNIDLHGFNCRIPDSCVPGSEAEAELLRDLDVVLGDEGAAQ